MRRRRRAIKPAIEIGQIIGVRPGERRGCVGEQLIVHEAERHAILRVGNGAIGKLAATLDQADGQRVRNIRVRPWRHGTGRSKQALARRRPICP